MNKLNGTRRQFGTNQCVKMPEETYMGDKLSVRQPLLEVMTDTNRTLRNTERGVEKLREILFGVYVTEGENQKESVETNIEEQANEAMYSAERLQSDIMMIVDRLVDR
jgi:hypothetical protein